MTAQIQGDDGEILTQAFDIAVFVPDMAVAASTMDQYDGRSAASAVIGNPYVIEGCCK